MCTCVHTHPFHYVIPRIVVFAVTRPYTQKWCPHIHIPYAHTTNSTRSQAFRSGQDSLFQSTYSMYGLRSIFSSLLLSYICARVYVRAFPHQVIPRIAGFFFVAVTRPHTQMVSNTHIHPHQKWHRWSGRPQWARLSVSVHVVRERVTLDTSSLLLFLNVHACTCAPFPTRPFRVLLFLW